MNSLNVPPDVRPYLEEFILLYTGDTTISQSTAQQLMVIGHLLQLEDLVNDCARFLKSHLDLSNALTTYRLVKITGCSDLAERTLFYLGVHWAEVAQTQEFLDLPLQIFQQILSSDAFIVNNELEIVVSVVRWLEHDPETRVPLWYELIPFLRLSRLSTEVLDKVWKNIKNTQLGKILHIFSVGLKVAQADKRQRGNSTLYVVGGVTDKIVSNVFKYDIHEKVWEVVAPMSTPRCRLGVAVLNGRLYAVGGNDGGPLASGELYDPSTNKWSAIAAMNTARKNFGLAALGGKLYAFGGYGVAGALSSVEVYDPLSDTWIAAADMPHGRYKMGVVVYEGVVYLTGGISPTGDGSAVLRYDVTAGSGGQWHSCTPMSYGRYVHSSVVLGGHLYVIGGCDEKDNASNTVARYDSATDRWEDVTPMKEHRYLCMAGAVGNRLLVAGGFGTAPKLSVEMYDVGKNLWLPNSVMPQICHAGGCVTL